MYSYESSYQSKLNGLNVLMALCGFAILFEFEICCDLLVVGLAQLSFSCNMVQICDYLSLVLLTESLI